MHGVFHPQRVEWESIVGFPEGLERDNVFEQDRLSVLVRSVIAMPVMIESPGVLEGRGTHASKHVHFGGVALRGDC